MSKKKRCIRNNINKKQCQCIKDLWWQKSQETRAYLVIYNADGWRRPLKEAEMKLENYFMPKKNNHHAGFAVSKKTLI